MASNLSRQFLVELPAHFDIRDPVIQVADAQAHDMASGEAVSWIVTSKHGISNQHAREVLKDAARMARRKVTPEGRFDLRHIDFVTVDPLGSTDLDDAFAAELHDDGYHLYTAIADVPALVHYNTSVDREAYARGVTYYLKDYTAHMLPPVLSTRKCSLLPNEDRLALVVRQKLDWDCSLKGYDVMAAVIRSRSQLTYGQFYDLLEQDDPRFRAMATIHEIRRRRDMNADITPFLKEDPGQYATKSIVETLMVQTNVLLAQYLKAQGAPFLSRNFETDTQGRGGAPRAQYSPEARQHAQIGMLYAHFTSPIRRYADIFNIRAAHKVLGSVGHALHPEEIERQEQIAAHLNERRRVERDVQHDMQKYHAMRDLSRLQQAPIRLNISDIGPDFVEVLILQSGIRQRVPETALDQNMWRLDKDKAALVLLDEQGRDVRAYSRTDSLLGRVYDVDAARAKWSIALLPHEQTLRPAKSAGAKPV